MRLKTLLFLGIIPFMVAYQRAIVTSPKFRTSPLLMLKDEVSSKKQSLLQIFRDQGLSVGAGVTGIFVLLANRLSVDLDKVTDVQSRADIISVVACSALLLNVLNESDIEARDRLPVPLMGYALPQPLLSESLEPLQSKTALWAIQTILRMTPATSVHVVLNQSEVVARGGVIGLDDEKLSSFQFQDTESKMGIFYKSVTEGEEVYLPDLQILPGKIEFGFLPANAQSLVILPFTPQSHSGIDTRGNGALVISTNQAKVLRLVDLQKIRVVCKLLKLVF